MTRGVGRGEWGVETGDPASPTLDSEVSFSKGTDSSATPHTQLPTPTILLIATVAVAAVAFAQSYARWLDPIIDTGRDLYIPEQIAKGAKLYRDIRYEYPPLAPYLLALITGAIGHSLAAYIAIGIAQSAAVAASLWIALRRPLPTFAATFTFVAACFCGGTLWNLIFPYSYAATIGMALLCIALAAFVHARYTIAIGALVLASWCKVEYAIAALLIVVILSIARRITWQQAAAYCGAMLATTAAFVFAFRDAQWNENIFAAWQHGERARRFFAVVSGVANWRGQLVQIAIGVGGIAAILFLQRWRSWIAGIAIVIVALLLTGHAFFRAWAVLQWIALGWALLRDRESPLVIFAAFSVACTLRIPLNVSPTWYGVVLTIPTIALAAYALFCYLPRRNAMAVLWLAPFVFSAGADLWQQHEQYTTKRYAIVTPRGTFFDANADRARTITSVIGAVQGGTLAVIPEGITINYLAAVPATLSFHTFTPVEVDSPEAEDAIVRELTAHPPDRVLMVSRDLREYGATAFGVDYDVRAGALLRSRYRVERIWRGERFQATLFTRRRGDAE